MAHGAKYVDLVNGLLDGIDAPRPLRTDDTVGSAGATDHG
jgi:hypothetical protein